MQKNYKGLLVKKLLFLICILVTSVIARDDVDYFKEKDLIIEKLDKGLEAYKKGDAATARQLASEAYFQHFENMEGPIGRNIGKKGFFMERKFTNLRSYYGKGEKINKIEALIYGLKLDLEEVTPIIQDGFKIKAVASDPNYDKAKAEINARENLLKSCIEGEMMFGSNESDARTKCEEQKAAEIALLAKEASGEVQKPVMQKEVFDSLESLQAAASIDPRLQYVYDLLSEKFDEAMQYNKLGDYIKAADTIGSAREEIYINTNIEILINATKNINMRSKLRSFGSDIRSGKVSENDMREKSEELLNEIFEVMTEIDVSNLDKLKLVGYVDETKNVDYTQVATDIKIALTKIVQDYENVGEKASINSLQSVYLDIFEAKGMESKIGAIDSSVKLAIEEKFTKGTALIKSKASKEELEANFDELNKLIASQLDKISDTSVWFLFISSLTIILREGLEALIIVVAIISYIIQSGNKDRLNIAYSALGTGVVLSFITAFIVSYFISNSGQSRELIEGVTMLIAVALLFYVGFWLLSNARNKKYASNLKEQAKMAITSGSAKTLWWTVFLAVFREGAETILFYQALLIDSGSSAGLGAVIGGLALGLVILVILYFLLKAGAIRIPIKQFFLLTSIVIFYMCFVFTGKGIMELVEGKVLTPHLISTPFESITWLGLYPYYESLVLQAIILLLLIGGVLYMQIKSKEKQ